MDSPSPRKPAFADWPTIKVLNVPTGRYSPRTDEWCITYCKQNVAGRVHGREPDCRSICIRKVFPHEVRNIVSFKRHREVDTSGNAKYPLPPEGQPHNVSRLMGGTAGSSMVSGEHSMKSQEPQKTWDEGWYFWTSSSLYGGLEKLDMMKLDLEGQQRRWLAKEKRKAIWHEYVEYLENRSDDGLVDQTPSGKWHGPIVPPRPIPDVSSKALLVPIPPDSQVIQRVRKLLVPSQKIISLFQDNLESGQFLKFGEKVWEKAWTREPFVLASRAFSVIYEMWKNGDRKE